MNYLSVSNLSKSFGELKLFNNISFGLEKGQRAGLVAKNGAGKSTLLKILLGEDIQDEGTIAFREGLTVKCLDQEPDFGDAETLEDYIYASDNPLMNLITEYEACLAKGETDSERFIELMNQIDEKNAWGIDVRISEVLTNLKFPDKMLRIKNLSGGQARRLALAKSLIENPDILFLDEPTNHLDFGMVEWLEKFIADSQLTILLITHDRYFLDNVCNDIFELSPDSMYHYKGDYEFYLTKKAERENNSLVVANKAKNLFKSELEWLRKQPKARGTKSKSRIAAAHEIEKVSKSVSTKKEIDISSVMTRMGSKICEMEKVSKSYGDLLLLKDFTYFFKRGEKVGIIGKNGTGKSTFLNLITGKDTYFEGSIEVGSTIKFGYYNQKGLNFRTDMKVIDVVKDIAEVIEMKDGSRITASQMLTHFQFEPKKQHTFVEKLSGGEKKRLYLVTVLMENPNFLILDEPTNDLDLGTLTALENFLLEFTGCVIIVSHDRYFLDRIVEHLFVFKGEGLVKDFPGNYTEFREFQKSEEGEEVKEKKEPKPVAAPVVEKKVEKLTYKERLAFEKLELEIQELEIQKETIESKLNEPGLEIDEINKVSLELGALIETLDEKSLLWLELSEKA